MTDDGQKTLENFDAAEELDVLGAKFFKPLSNIEYILTFKPVEGEAKHPAWQLRQIKGQDEVMCAVLVVGIDSINGKPVNQEWSIWSANLRKIMQTPCMNGSLLKKRYKFKKTEKPTTFSFFELGDR